MVAPHSIDHFAALVAQKKGEMLFRSDKVESMKGIPQAFELTWNHTTLRALKVDPSFTYLQVQYPGPDHVERVRKMTDIFGDEVPGHLEFIRFSGRVQCSGLPLVRYTTRERLEEIIRIHEDHGCPIFNPPIATTLEGGWHESRRMPCSWPSRRKPIPKGCSIPAR